MLKLCVDIADANFNDNVFADPPTPHDGATAFLFCCYPLSELLLLYSSEKAKLIRPNGEIPCFRLM